MMDTIITIVVIATIMLGIPLAICFFKDWFVLKKYGNLAPDGSRRSRIDAIEQQLNTRQTTVRGVLWLTVATLLGAWLIYKNLVWQPQKRELHDLLGVAFVVGMANHGIALIRFKGEPEDDE